MSNIDGFPKKIYQSTFLFRKYIVSLGVCFKTFKDEKVCNFSRHFFHFTLGWSYTWKASAPDSIHATNICFGVGSWKGVICSPEGMYLWEEDIEEWTFYTYGGLPVTGAAYLNTTQILVAMGCGTYSDGIYTFDLETHQFEVVELAS